MVEEANKSYDSYEEDDIESEDEESKNGDDNNESDFMYDED